ncbi:MAG: hypothetical protein JXA11_13355 [Phycisphaerae bacterium]|nr:hypothetical protein [Phycisphaerae bacterium]
MSLRAEGTHLIRLGYYPKWRDHQRTPYLNIDPEKIVRQAHEIGVSVLEWAVPENHIFIEWDGVQPHPHQSLYQGDLLADVCAACRKYGIKILLCWATNAVHEDMDAWLKQDAETLQRTGYHREKAGRFHNHICPNYSRHRDWVAGYVRALAERYDIDGFIFDGPWFRYHHVWPRNADGTVACEICRDAYRKRTGRDVPPAIDWSCPEFRDYVSYFKNHVYRGYMDWLSGVVREINPDLYISYNSPVYVWGGWGDTSPWDGMGNLADSMYVEMHLAGREELQPVLQLKLNRAALGGKAPEMYCKTFDLAAANFAYSTPPACEVRALGYLTLSEAGIIGIHSSMDENGDPHPERTNVYVEYGRELKPMLPYFRRAVPVEHTGVLLSERTRDLYAGENPSQYLVSPIGMTQILAESQKTYGFLLDSDLDNADRLKQHRVVVLANAAYLTESQADAVRQYVRDGGSLLVTGETSLYDYEDSIRGDFLLADVLGVHYGGISISREEYKESPLFHRYPFLLREHDMAAGLQDRMITRRPWFDIEADSDRDVVATWADVRADTDFGCVNGGLEILGDTRNPMLVAGSFGRGKVVYCSADLTGQYMFEMNRHIRALLKQTCRWLHREPLEIDAPKHIHFAATAQPEPSRVILHFVNILYSNKSANEVLGHGFPFDPMAYQKRMGTAPMRNSRLQGGTDELTQTVAEYRGKFTRRESYCPTGTDQLSAFDEVFPIRGIKARINTDVYPFKKVIDIRTGEPLSFTITEGNWCEIPLPETGVYMGLALEM